MKKPIITSLLVHIDEKGETIYLDSGGIDHEAQMPSMWVIRRGGDMFNHMNSTFVDAVKVLGDDMKQYVVADIRTAIKIVNVFYGTNIEVPKMPWDYEQELKNLREQLRFEAERMD